MTISTVAAGQTIDPDWGNSIATAINTIEAAWTSYTATTTGITIGTGGTVVTRRMKYGRTCHYQGTITLGTGGVLTGAPTVSLPFNSAATGITQVGAAEFRDFGTEFRPGAVRLITGTTLEFEVYGPVGGVLSATGPWTWAVSDQISWNVTYETAS